MDTNNLFMWFIINTLISISLVIGFFYIFYRKLQRNNSYLTIYKAGILSIILGVTSGVIGFLRFKILSNISGTYNPGLLNGTLISIIVWFLIVLAGIIFLKAGLANKDKWKKQRASTDKQTKIGFFVLLIVVIMILVFELGTCF